MPQLRQDDIRARWMLERLMTKLGVGRNVQSFGDRMNTDGRFDKGPFTKT